jgi:TPR repeat protein
MRAASRGDLGAQLTLGRLYLDGDAGLPLDPRAACLWLGRAAAKGSDEAAQVIATRIPAAAVIAPASVLQYFETAAARGNTHAKKVLADWCLSGAAGAVDMERALGLLLELADAGETGAQLRLGLELLSDTSGDVSRADAVCWLERAAQAGSRAARRLLGQYLLERGNDPERAAYWLGGLASAGDAEMGTLFGIALLRQERRREAVRWLAKSAQRGECLAQLWLGRAYLESQGSRSSGLPRSYKQAARWLERAAARDNPDACLALSRLYLRRSFSGRDASRAQRYLERAAMLGSVDAQYDIGHACLRRGAVSDNDVRGTCWLARAATGGHLAAARLLNDAGLIAPRLAEELRARHEALVRALGVLDLPLSCRLEVAYAFALTLPEALLLDPVHADRGECLLVTRQAGVRGSMRRVRVVLTREQRDAVDRAKRLIRPDRGTDVRAVRVLAERMATLLQLCHRLRLDTALLPPAAPQTGSRSAARDGTSSPRGTPGTSGASREGRAAPALPRL